MAESAALLALQAATHAAVVAGPGSCPAALREAIAAGRPPADLAHLVATIRAHAYRLTEADVDSLRAAYTEDQLFEIIVAAAVGAAEHRLRAALGALEQA